MSDKHECPYGGKCLEYPGDMHSRAAYLDCGHEGFLCHACREDRADARAEVLRDVINTGFDNVAQTLWDKKP